MSNVSRHVQHLTEKTFQVRIYVSGPIEHAKALLRKEVMRKGLCVTIEPTTFIYSGGEESGYVVGLIQYPRFPARESSIVLRAKKIANLLMRQTAQWSALVVAPDKSIYMSCRPSLAPPSSGPAKGAGV